MLLQRTRALCDAFKPNCLWNGKCLSWGSAIVNPKKQQDYIDIYIYIYNVAIDFIHVCIFQRHVHNCHSFIKTILTEDRTLYYTYCTTNRAFTCITTMQLNKIICLNLPIWSDLGGEGTFFFCHEVHCFTVTLTELSMLVCII